MTMTFVDIAITIFLFLLPRLALSVTNNQLRQDVVAVDVVEKSPPGTVICNVKDLALTLAPDNKTRVNKHLLRFQIKTPASTATVASSGNGSTFFEEDFKINETTGELATKRSLDRDLLCPGLELCTSRLDVQVTPIEYYQLIRINLRLVDINDHTPVFPSNESKIFISSNSKKGQLLQLPFALDPDEGRNGSVEYELVGLRNDTLNELDDFLSLGVRICNDNQSCPVLEVIRDFNSSFPMERLSSPYLLLAKDQGLPPLTGSTVVKLDFLHSSPQAWLAFEKMSYSVSVQENREAGLALLEVKALRLSRYPSASDLATIFYSLVKMGDDCADAFRVNSSTGVVTSTKLDYELFQSCSFQVKASLLIPQPSTAAASEAAKSPATAVVVVDVGNVNDNAPTIELLISRSKVKAGSPEGTLVTQLEVRDLDDASAGLNNSVNCSVDSSPQLFQLQQTPPPRHHQYDLVTSSTFPLQRFSSSVLSVNIFCSDSGGIITKQRLLVDVIRRAPAFRNGSLLITLESSQLELSKVLVEKLDISPGDSDATVFSIRAHDERHSGMLEIKPDGRLLRINGSCRGGFKTGSYLFNITVADSVDSNLNDTMVFQLVVELSTTVFPSSPLIQVNSKTASNTLLLVSTPTYTDSDNINNSYYHNSYYYSDNGYYSNRNNTYYQKDFSSGKATAPNLVTPSNNSSSNNYNNSRDMTSSNSPTLTNNDDRNISIIITAIACGSLIVIIIIISAVVVMINRYKFKNGQTTMPSTRGSTGSPLRPTHPGSSHAEEDEEVAMSADVSPPTVEIRDEESLRSVTDSGKGQSGEEEVNFSSAVVPNPRSATQYWSAAQVLPGRQRNFKLFSFYLHKLK